MFVEGKLRTVFFLQILFLRHLSRRLKKSLHTRLENMILGQLRMGDHQMTSALLLIISFFTLFYIVRALALISVSIWPHAQVPHLCPTAMRKSFKYVRFTM